MKKNSVICLLMFFVLSTSGCAVIFQTGRRSDIEKIQALEQELGDLRNARNLLQERLSQEIQDSRVKVSMQEKGLVITFLAEVLFDSGKAKLKQDSLPILEKVATIIRE